MSGVVVVGAGGHARMCLDVLGEDPDVVVRGVVGTPNGPLRVPHLGGDEALPALLAEGCTVLVAVGDNARRAQVTERLAAAGWQFATAVSRSAAISPSAVVGAGSVVMPSAVVGADARLGRGVVLNTMASVDHDGDLQDFVHVAPGSHLAGGVRVEEGAFLGVGVSVVPDVVVGRWAVVGAGAAVVADVPPGVTSVGVPARPRGAAR